MTVLKKGQLSDELEEEREERPYNISTIKPDGTEDYESKPEVNQAEIWTSIAQTKKAFSALGFSVESYEFEIYGPNGRKLGGNKGTELFFKRVDISNEPIVQTITTIKRLKAWEHYRNKNGKEQRKVTEYITYNADLEGYDRVGNRITAKIENQGLCYEPDVRVKITHDEYGKPSSQYTYDHLRDKYYLPYSPKLVNELLKKTNTNKDNIRYYCEVGSDPSPNSRGIRFRCTDFTYEQFVNSSFEELEALARREGGPTGISHWKDAEPRKVWAA